jgi:hypothetical protein
MQQTSLMQKKFEIQIRNLKIKLYQLNHSKSSSFKKNVNVQSINQDLMDQKIY